MKPCRIAMVMGCPFPAAQGTQVLVEQMSRSLVRRGHDVHTVAYHFGDPARTVDLTVHRAKGFPGYRRIRSGPDWRKPFLDWNLTRTLMKVVKDYDIQIIHAHNYEAPLAAYTVRCKTGVPVVYHAHNLLSEELPTYFNNKWWKSRMRSLGYALDKYIPPRGDLNISLNPGIRHALITHGAVPERSLYIPPAIEALPVNGHTTFQTLTAIYLGNLDGYQNLDFLLDTWKLVLTQILNARLLIATHGDGSRLRKYVRKIGLADHVEVRDKLNFQESLDLLMRSHVAVNPRFGWWGFPIKLLNYMETGRAIVSCRGSAHGLRHLENAWIVENGDGDNFARGIIELFNNPDLATTLGLAAHETVREDYAWERVVPQLEQSYERALYDT
jgi:glycosyltransferase involved in cell wall biosynthesis